LNETFRYLIYNDVYDLYCCCIYFYKLPVDLVMHCACCVWYVW